MIIKFNYSKKVNDAAEVSARVLLFAKFYKYQPSKVKVRKFEDCNYVHGFTIDADGLLPSEAVLYEQALCEWMSLQTDLASFLLSKGLESERIQQKDFIKDQISDIQITEPHP